MRARTSTDPQACLAVSSEYSERKERVVALVVGLLHAWYGHHQCQIVHSLGADFWATYLENGLELCNQTSQKHS